MNFSRILSVTRLRENWALEPLPSSRNTELCESWLLLQDCELYQRNLYACPSLSFP